jgi:osmoprotectant transport system ATP-binding protein
MTKSLGDHRVLDDISVSIATGRTTAVLGESGCGKTTLLNHINGLLKPDRGTVEVFGEPIDYQRLPELRRHIGYAVQSVGLFPHLTVSGNLALMARLSEWPPEKIAARSDELMQSMKLSPELLGRYPHELSGGQQQRVAICRAMMLKPDLLLLDEPFSGVDPINRLRIQKEFRRLMEAEPATTLLVTHDVREAVRLASDLIVMESGRVLQQGSVKTVMDSPATESIDRLFREHADRITVNGRESQ